MSNICDSVLSPLVVWAHTDAWIATQPWNQKYKMFYVIGWTVSNNKKLKVNFRLNTFFFFYIL